MVQLELEVWDPVCFDSYFGLLVLYKLIPFILCKFRFVRLSFRFGFGSIFDNNHFWLQITYCSDDTGENAKVKNRRTTFKT